MALSIVFDAAPALRLRLSEETDKAIEAARKRAEKRSGQRFATDPRTGFPPFTLFEGEQEVGGG